MHRDYPTLLQFLKYALAGGLATLTHIVIFHLAGWKLFPVLQERDHAVRMFGLATVAVDDTRRARNSVFCNCIAFLIANMVAYITNILWVFQTGRHSFLVEILLFYTVSGISVLLGTMLMGTLIKRFGILTTWAFGANICTAVMINYILRKFYIFAG